ncbi:Na+/H+ antiporter [Streptomyces sp. NPDC055056]
MLTAVLILTWLAKRLHLSEPLLLLCGGSLIGLLPHLHELSLPAETVLLIFLPPLLYAEALTISLHQIRINLRAIALLAVGLVLVTMLTVASTAHAFGLAWPVAFVLGAVVAPTDASAVASVAHGMPRRTLTTMQAESLVNDGAALVAYAVALEIAVGRHPFNWGNVVGRFAWSYAGGIAIGAAVAFLVIAARRVTRDARIDSGLSVLTPFAAYLPAELTQASGVLAVVVCGLMISRASPLLIPARSRVQTQDFWNVTTFLLNGSLFVLVGIQLPAAARNLTSLTLGQATVLAAAISAVVIATRLLYVYFTPYASRALGPRNRQSETGMARRTLPVAWGGVRGGISLAAALAVPAVTVTGEGLDARDVIIFVTAAVIVVTLLLQGQTLPTVIRMARLPEDPDAEAEELLAHRTIAKAALQVLPEEAERLDTPPTVVDRVGRELREHAGITQGPAPSHHTEAELRKAVMDTKRGALVRLRNEGRIDDGVLRHIQRALDAEEVRLDLGLGADRRQHGKSERRSP